MLFTVSLIAALLGFAVGYTLKHAELRYTVYTVAALVLTLGIPGGRVLVLPMIFALILVVSYWMAKPRAED